jgi:hypothetical protein
VVENFAMWRQPGVQTETAIDPVKFYVGCFNGADIPNNTTDNNNAKDFMVRLDAMPKLENMKLLVGGAYWMGRRFVDACHNKDLSMIDIFASLDYQKAKFRGEYMMRTLVEGWDKDPSTPELDDLKSAGFYVTGGYTVLDWLEVLARYDSYDPNTDLEDNPATPNFDESEDGLSRITLGLNFMIHKYNAVIALNLVKNMEQYEVSDPSTADPTDTMEFPNDEAIVQFQISF